MSKEMWIEYHEQAIAEAMEIDPTLDWSDAYEAEATAKRASELLRERLADMIDEAKMRGKYD